MTESDEKDSKNVQSRLENLEEGLEEVKTRINQLEEGTETKVRVVDTDNGKKIVLENRQQTWFSPNYFRKILDNLEEE